MREYSVSTICNLLFFGTGLPWGCFGEGSAKLRRNVRRRTRYISGMFIGRHGTLISKDSLWNKDEDLVLDGRLFSMPDTPTPVPAKPPTREDRDLLIQDKCNVTAIERSRDILTELLTVSDSSSLTNPETSQFKARNWLDKIDPALVCPKNRDRIDQRYKIALLYFELGGNSWTRCKAELDVTTSEMEEECMGKRFLDKANECEWGGLSCGDSFSDATAEWLDAFYPLQSLNLQSNNLVGNLFDEFYDLPNLKKISLKNNNLSGTISDEIRNFDSVTDLELEFNSFEGAIPEEGLLGMEKLVGLSIQGNNLQGSLDKLCNTRDDFEKVEADCLGEPQEVTCSCCICF